MRQLLKRAILGWGLLVTGPLLAEPLPETDPARLVAEVAAGQHKDLLGIRIDRGGQTRLAAMARRPAADL